MKQTEIDKRAKKLADHVNGPLGRIPLKRVFEKHISFLEELRQFGATWEQIAQLLFAHGVTQKSGNILHANQVRGTFARVKEKSLMAQALPRTPSSPNIHDQLRNTDLESSNSDRANSLPPNETSEHKKNTNKSLNRDALAPIKTTVHNSDIRRKMAQSLKVRK